MKKAFLKLLTIIFLIPGCYARNNESYVYNVVLNVNSESKLDFDASYNLSIKKDDLYSIYLNYILGEGNDAWSETLNKLRDEGNSGNMLSSVYIKDKHGKIIYFVQNSEVRLKHGGSGKVGMQIYPKYSYLKRGDYSIDIFIKSKGKFDLNKYKNQIEITSLYRSK